MSVLASLHPGLQRYVHEHWGGHLTEIQEAAIPVILSGSSCVLEAPTAGGKTESVLFPALTRAAASSADGVHILYLAPLRALLNNLELRAHRYADLVGVAAFKWHGDVSYAAKREQLTRPPHLLLTTPESLEAILLRRSEWRQVFAALQVIVIDEAHSFAAGDRGGHLLSLMQRVSTAAARPPQRVGMTATIGNAEEMATWLVGVDDPPAQRVAVPRRAPPPRDWMIRFFDGSRDTDQTPAKERASWRTLASLAETCSGHKSIVFAGSRKRAEALAEQLKVTSDRGLLPPVRARTHHGNVSRFFREAAEEAIQVAGETGLDAIISTLTLELGIDLGPLERVVQLNAVASSSALLQRVGRTGRRAGGTQHLRGLCSDRDDLLVLIGATSLAWQGRAEALAFPGRAFHLLAHQLLCLSLQLHGVAPDTAWRTLRPVSCFRYVARAQFDALVAAMVRADYLRDADGLLVFGEKGESTFLSANWRKLYAVFEDAPLFDVFEGKNQVGTLDVSFVTQPLVQGFVFTLGGIRWQAEHIDLEGRRVLARRSTVGEPPRWSAFGGPDVPRETAEEVGRLLHVDTSIPPWLDDASANLLREERAAASAVPWTPGTWMIVDAELLTITTFAGDRINRTLGRVLEDALGVKVTGDYQGLRLGRRGTTDAPGVQSALEAWSRAAPEARLGRLVDGTKVWRFSPFADCVPAELQRLALVERTLDPWVKVPRIVLH